MPSSTPIAAAEPNPAGVTLDNCATEPIRIPGSIQPHGFLLGLGEDFEHVVVASRSAAEYLGTPLKLILNAPIGSLFQRELLTAIEHQRCAMDPDGMVAYLGSFGIRGEVFSLVSHCVEGKPLLEFERQDRLVGAEMMNSVITNFVSTLSRLETEQDLCEAVTRQVAALTGFDRILLYCFDEEGHGIVLSEANSGSLPSYLDLRFPASDIPRQARDLYVLNTVRIIPDADYTPSPLERADAADTPHILDLSLSILRSVSPIHLEYMRNMGTAASMSISIVSEGRLWGLISCHHAEPRMVPYLVRSACDMLSKLVGTQITAFLAASRLRTAMHFHAVQRQLLTYVAAATNYLAELARHMPQLMQVTDAAGAALWLEGRCECVGNPPSEADVRRIVEWLDTKPGMDLYETRQLSADLPWTADLADTASGLLAVRISDVRQRYVLWFRPQVVRTVQWAGEHTRGAVGEKLHPRKSFESWRETVRGQSLPWGEVEIDSAREFLSAITTISLRRAEEEAELSAARFELLTQALPEKIFTADDNGVLTFTNDRWREHGLSDTGVWFGQGQLLPEDEERVARRWAEAVASGEPIEEEVRMLSGVDRVPRWNLMRAVPFRRQGGVRAGWIGSLIDLTDRREREAALRMTEKLALTGRMTSVIAHEINNPLESITNLLYLVRQDVSAGSEAAQYIAQAEGELERIAGITKQTLRWGRENSGRVERFCVGTVFSDVLRLFSGKLRNRSVEAQVRGGSGVMVDGIVGQIRQVIANLVANAIDAAHVGGKVWLEARDDGEAIEIVIGDDGVGMGPEVRSQLFQPFFSTKGDLGNGLGLYISHEIVERHGGRLRVDTAPEKGTTVHVFLPVNVQITPSAPTEADLLLS